MRSHKFGKQLMMRCRQDYSNHLLYSITHDSANREVLDEYERILSTLDGKDLTNVRQSWGLKMEQLKGELQQLENLHADHD